MSDSMSALLITFAIFAFLIAWIPVLDLCEVGCRKLLARRSRRHAASTIEAKEHREPPSAGSKSATHSS
jgi:hypothetical protein